MPPTEQDLARRLLALPHATFKEEVNADLRPPRRDEGPNDDTDDPVKRGWIARHEALRSPGVVDRWFTVLSQISKSVDGQLAASTEDYEAHRANTRAKLLSTQDPDEETRLRSELEKAKSNYSRSRAKILRFKTGLDEALIEARSLRDGIRDRVYDSVVAEERNRYAARVALLEDAIRAHRDTADAENMDPEPHDEALWAVIER